MIKHSQLRKAAINRFKEENFTISNNISYRDLASIINIATGWGGVLKKSKKQVYKEKIRRFYYETPSIDNTKVNFLKYQQAKIPKKKEFCQTDDFLGSFEWRRVRFEALKKNNGCCELCGRNKHDDIKLNVDHIKPRKKHPELALDVNNLQVLCNECNHGKGNWDETDWRK